MASFGLMSDDGFLRADGGLAVREDCPGGCCGVTFWRLEPCACSGGLTTLWTRGYDPSMGCVWAKYNGDCYTICSDGVHQDGLGSGDQEVSPLLTAAASAEAGCAACCDTGGTTCCDVSGGTCGLVRTAPPYVRCAQVFSARTYKYTVICNEGSDTPCAEHLVDWLPTPSYSVNPWCSQDFGPCIGSTSLTRTTNSQGPRICVAGNDPVATSFSASFGCEFNLYQSIDYQPLNPPGYNDGATACVGTAATIPGPAVGGFADFGGGGQFYQGPPVHLEFARSLADPGLWWLWARSDFGQGSLDLGGLVEGAAGCGGGAVCTLDFVHEVSALCNGQPRIRRFECGVTLTLDFDGIAGCGSARPSGGRPPPMGRGAIGLRYRRLLNAPPLDANAEQIAAYLARDPLRGCAGCGQ